MAHKKKHTNPVPPGNQTETVIGSNMTARGRIQAHTKSFQNQDPKRRLGNFEGAGEHAYQQPGGKNDANR